MFDFDGVSKIRTPDCRKVGKARLSRGLSAIYINCYAMKRPSHSLLQSFVLIDELQDITCARSQGRSELQQLVLRHLVHD